MATMGYIVFHHQFEEAETGWTWLKFPSIPPETMRNNMKEYFQARWGRRKQAWYIKYTVPVEQLEEVLGSCIGVVEGRAPTKTWDYCLTLVQ